MQKFINQLKKEKEGKIFEITDPEMSRFDYYLSCYRIMRWAFRELKAFVETYHFRTIDEEIHFFKEIKPEFQRELLFYIEMLDIERNITLSGSGKILIAFYKKRIRYYNKLCERNAWLYHYVKTNASSYDSSFFVRSAENQEIYSDDIDENFSTAASTELSKILAYEMVIREIEHRINALQSKKKSKDSNTEFRLFWTDAKVALIELAYALQSCGAVNQGKASVAQIIKALEYIFNIDLGNYYRVFQNIRIRQGSRSAFLDTLIVKLIERMDETDLKL